MTNYRKDWAIMKLPAIIAVVVLVVVLLWVGVSYGQQPVVVTGEPLPDDIDTWEELVAYWWPKVVSGALLLIGSILTFAIRNMAAMAPAVVKELISEKRKRDLHSGVMTIVSRMVTERRWPTVTDMEEAGRQVTDGMLVELRDGLMKSNPQAADFAELMTQKGMSVLRDLAIRYGIEVQAKLNAAGAKP